MPAEYTPNPTGIAALVRAPGGAVAADLLRRCIRVHARAVVLCRANTGRLRSSIRFWLDTMGGQVVGVVGTDVEYALYVHEGTKAHVIEPRNKSVLRFQVADGRVVFAQRVNHPGTRGNPFLRDALPAAG